MKLRQYEQALSYFSQVPSTAGEHHRSAIAAMGDIAREMGDNDTALKRYNEARDLGGSTMYSISTLNYKIESIQKRQEEKAAEPVPLSIRVRHLHSGLLRGSCQGVLTVNSTGMLYRGDGGDDFSANFVGVRVQVVKNEMTVSGFTKNPQKFKTTGNDADRFREALSRYQNAAK
jgi:hypothetical protein